MFDLHGIAGLSDDGVIVYGDFLFFGGWLSRGLAHLDSSGTVDPNFYESSLTNYSEGAKISTVVQQPDGKIIVAGSFHLYAGILTTNNVVRLQTNGALDSSFDGAGAGSSGSEINAVVVHPTNGKIFLGGYFSTFAGAPRSNIAWANSDGSLDSSFAGLSGVTDYNPAISALAIQPDGKILVAGSSAPSTVLPLQPCSPESRLDDRSLIPDSAGHQRAGLHNTRPTRRKDHDRGRFPGD